MNENHVSGMELVRRLGLEPLPENYLRMREYLMGRNEPRKHTIDRLIALTGMRYEERFYV